MRTRRLVLVLGLLAAGVCGCAGRATRNIERLLGDLASDSRRRVARAERNLAEHGRAAIKPLTAIVTGEDVEKFELSADWTALRVPAARALGLMAAKASLARSEAELAAKPLLTVLGNKDEDRALRIEAAKALGHFTQLATPVNDLILLLREDEPALVEAARASLVSNALHAVYRLILDEEPVAAPAARKDWARLLERLGSTDDDIRLDTVRELAASRDRRAAGLLLQRLAKDASGEVRYAALRYCQSVAAADPDGTVAAGLHKQLPESFANDADSRVVLVAAQVLAPRQPELVRSFGERAKRATELVVNKLLDDARSREYDAAARADAVNALALASSQRRDELLAELVDPSRGEAARIRRAAASVLASSDSALASQALHEAMSDDDSIVRLVAATALGRRGNTDAVTYLVELLSHPEAKIRTPAADALGTLGAKAVPVLVEQLDTSLARAAELAHWEAPLRELKHKTKPTPEDAERMAELEDAVAAYCAKAPDRREMHIAWGLVTGLGSIAADIGPEAAPALDPVTRAARCHYVDVRRAAANALGSFDDARATPALAAALEDPDATVRWYAASALEARGAAAAPALVAALADPATAAIAARSLGRIAGPDALQPVLERLTQADGEARVALVWCLGELLGRHPDAARAPAAREALRKASQLDDDPEAARLARYALAKAAAPK